jgi:MFS family permease
MSQPVRGPAIPGILLAGCFLAGYDLAVIDPLLVPVSRHFGVSLGTAAFVLTGYLLPFGILQPVHGIVADAIGRVRVLRMALLGLAAGNLIAALAPDLGVLIAGRAIAGAFGAGIIPATVAYLGDRIAAPNRRRTRAGLLSCGGLGAAVATGCAGGLTELLDWRAALGLLALAGPALAMLYRRLPETGLADWAHQPSVAHRIRRVLGAGRLRLLIALSFVAGAAMLGFVNFFSAAVQEHGGSPLLAGLVTSGYGLAALTGGLAVRVLDARLSGMLSGGLALGGGLALLLLGYLTAAGSQGAGAVLLAGLLSGAALAAVQPGLWAWVRAASPPEVRGSVVALIGCSAFTGAGVSTAAMAGLAGHGDFRALFGLAGAVTVLVILIGMLARARYRRLPQPIRE